MDRPPFPGPPPGMMPFPPGGYPGPFPPGMMPPMPPMPPGMHFLGGMPFLPRPAGIPMRLPTIPPPAGMISQLRAHKGERRRGSGRGRLG